MAIENAADLEEKLAEVCRYYRALYEVFSTTKSAVVEETTRWVLLGGSMIERLDAAVAEIEEYSGASDLRLVLNDLKEMRAKAHGLVEKGEV